MFKFAKVHLQMLVTRHQLVKLLKRILDDGSAERLFHLNSVDGGELFDRIIDENYKLMELDTVMFIGQICEGLRYMHKMYILHLDLKVPM